MVRKCLALASLLIFLVCGALAENRVVDEAGLFTADETAQIENAIMTFIDRTGMDFVVWTSAAPRSDERSLKDADDFFDNQGYGLGGDRSGALLFLDMATRIPSLSTSGATIDYVTDERLETLWDDRFYDYMSAKQYSDAALHIIQGVQRYVLSGIPEGQYQLDGRTGVRTTARHKVLTAGEIAFAAACGLGVALIIGFSVYRSYNLKGSTYRYDMRAGSTVDMVSSEDTYLRSTTRVIPKAQSSGTSGGGGRSGASTTRSSSSGRTHGGGSGRKF